MGLYQTRWESYKDSKNPSNSHQRVMVVLKKEYVDQLGISKTDKTVEGICGKTGEQFCVIAFGITANETI